MATWKSPDDEGRAPAPAAPHTSATPVIVWANSSLTRVEHLEVPPTGPRDGVCRCDACHAAVTADLAARFVSGS